MEVALALMMVLAKVLAAVAVMNAAAPAPPAQTSACTSTQRSAKVVGSTQARVQVQWREVMDW